VEQAPRPTLQQQFKVTNLAGLAMIASVFVYAALVLLIDKGDLPLKAKPVLDPSTGVTLKYILLGLALGQYFLIRFFHKFAQKSASYLASGAIIVYALCESVSIFGLVLFFLTGNSTDFFIFMLISVLYFYLFYPRFADWERVWSQGQSEKSSPE